MDTTNQENNEVKQDVSEKTVNVKSLNKRIDGLAETVDKIVGAVDKIVEKLNTPVEPKVEFKSPDAKPSEYKPTGYVPPKYRQIVDEVLSSEFGFDCQEDVNSMDFTISIVVPTRYSSLTAEEKKNGVQDIRSKVISRALGENGVRDWCVKVRENLNKFYTQSGVVSPFTKQ